jgi:hypothetical protein
VPNVSDRIANRVTFRTLDLMRFDATTRARVRRILLSVQNSLLVAIEDVDPSGVRRLSAREKRLAMLETQTRRTIATGYRDASRALHSDMVAVGNAEAMRTRSMIKDVVGVDLLTVSVPRQVVRAVSSDVLVQGAAIRSWMQRNGNALHKRLTDNLRMGVMQGETLPELRRRLKGSRARKWKDGVMAKSRHEADAVVRSAIIGSANAAREEVFRENADVIRGVQALVTLDLKTSEICIARAGAMWNLETRRPLSDSPYKQRYPGPPPWHFNCRTVLIPVMKRWDEITGRRGAALAKLPVGKRASMDGQVAGNLSFQDFLRKRETRHPGSADKLLGKTKARLWRQGKVKLPKLIDQAGQPISSSDLLAIARRKRR